MPGHPQRTIECIVLTFDAWIPESPLPAEQGMQVVILRTNSRIYLGLRSFHDLCLLRRSWLRMDGGMMD